MKRIARTIVSLLLCATGSVLFAQADPKTAPEAKPKPVLTNAEQVALSAILQKESDLNSQFRDQEQMKAKIIGDINQEHPDYVFDVNNGFIAKQAPAKAEAPKSDAKK